MNYKQLAKVLRYAETTEDDFHRILDSAPYDHQTRLVLSDFLQERNDPRAEGYRALGQLQKMPAYHKDNNVHHWYHFNKSNDVIPELFDNIDPDLQRNVLPFDWYMLTKPGKEAHEAHYHKSRKEADDAAALAFFQLPEERRKELLG
jgi:uncharacterized protein (TIGR02996 family)